MKVHIRCTLIHIIYGKPMIPTSMSISYLHHWDSINHYLLFFTLALDFFTAWVPPIFPYWCIQLQHVHSLYDSDLLHCIIGFFPQTLHCAGLAGTRILSDPLQSLRADYFVHLSPFIQITLLQHNIHQVKICGMENETRGKNDSFM